MRMYKVEYLPYILNSRFFTSNSKEAREKKKEKKRTKRGLTRRLYCYVYAYDAILIILF